MKIRKIAEYTEKGTEEKFEIVWVKEEEGWELSGKEMKTLRELLNSALGTAPIMYIPDLGHESVALLRNSSLQVNRTPEESIEVISLDPYVETPVISKSMGADLVPEVVCENGACRLVIPEEEEAIEIPEEKKPEPVKKERKKPGRKTNRDYSKYIVMKAEGHSTKEIARAMSDDFGVSIQSAENYYYAHVKNAVAPEQIPAVIEKEKKELLKEIEPKVRSKKKVDQEIFNSINDMIHYHTPQQFKDACVAADIGRGKYSVNDLKEMYLETHPEVRW